MCFVMSPSTTVSVTLEDDLKREIHGGFSPQVSRRQFHWRGILSRMDSANTDPELRHWLRWVSDSASTPMFVRTVAEAALIACSPDYVLLRPVLLELKRRYPEGLSKPKEPAKLRWADSQ